MITRLIHRLSPIYSFFFLLFYDSSIVRQDFDKNVFSKFESVITYNFINHQDELKTMYLKINYMHNNIVKRKLVLKSTFACKS